MRPSRERSRACAPEAGFTLAELLVAAVIAGLVLAAAYGWLWNVAALADRVDDRAQAATLASTASRSVLTDIRASALIAQPPEGRDPGRSIALVHDHVGMAAEPVLVSWDPSRQVLWRNASGTYVADHITGFDVAYLLVDGRLVNGDAMSARDWGRIQSLSVCLSATVGSVTAARSLAVTPGAG